MNKAESFRSWEAEFRELGNRWKQSFQGDGGWSRTGGKTIASPTGETGFQSWVSASDCQGICPQGREYPHSCKDKEGMCL